MFTTDLGTLRIAFWLEKSALALRRPVSRRHVHMLRHSAAVHLLDAGETIDFVRDFLGHRAISSTLVYGQISDSRRARAIRRLERSSDFVLPS
jgi:site-specific recombinase XerD